MIEIKATKAEGPTLPSHAQYVLKGPDKPLHTPIYAALFLAGIAAYLRSIFPNWGELGASASPDPAESPHPAAEEGAPRAKIIELPHGRNREPVPEKGPAPETPGKFLDLQPSIPFDLTEPSVVDLVDLNRFDAATPDARRVGSSSPASLPSPVNDNLQGAGNDGTSTGGQGGTMSARPGENAGSGSGSPPVSTGTGGAGGAPASVGDTGDPGALPADDDDEETRPIPNRAPRVTAPVNLYDVYGCAAVLISLSDLLRNVEDPDGDALMVGMLGVSSGSIVQTVGGWLYDPAELGPVVISYQVGDGEFWVDQVAHLSVVRRPAIVGTDGDDLLLGTDCPDEIDGRAGDDNIDGGGGGDSIVGADGADHVVAGAGDDIVHGGSGDDLLLGGDGDDWISGGAGNDRLFGNDGDDMIFGDQGHDLGLGGAGDDLIFGGKGDDRLFGEEDDDTLDGGPGDDELDGGSGQDVLIGSPGADTLDGGQGDDLLVGGTGADEVAGGEGDDTVSGDADRADDDYAGGGGRDTLDYSDADEAISADIAVGIAAGMDIGNDAFAGFEIFRTGSGEDTVTGSEANDEIHGGSGADRISDGGGGDVVAGGEGDDTVTAADDGADDCYEGGEGFDQLDYSAAEDGIVVDLGTGAVTGASVGRDMIAGFESVLGGGGDDRFVIGTDSVRLAGGAGADVFEFETTSSEGGAARVVHEILDFLVGDRIEMSRYSIFDEVVDTIEDQFEDIYGSDLERRDMPIRIRHEKTDETMKTYIEADFDNDNTCELMVVLDGQHALMVVEVA